MNDHEAMMLAVEQAKIAQTCEEVPIGAIITLEGEVIAQAYNQTLTLSDPTAHAEMLCIQQAASYIGNHRLIDSTLYVTLEPCIMCYGAIIQARIKRVVFGAKDPKTGVFSKPNLSNHLKLNHHPESQGGIEQHICQELLLDFFSQRR